MPTIDGRRYTGLGGLQLKGDGRLGSKSGVINFPNLEVDIPDTDDMFYLGVRSGVLTFVADGVATPVSGLTGGVATWDTLYGLDKGLEIDDASLTFTLTHATNDGLTLVGDAGADGDVLVIDNAGDGLDIKGNSWSIDADGVATFGGLALGDDIKFTLGDSDDVSIEYDEANDELLITADTVVDGDLTADDLTVDAIVSPLITNSSNTVSTSAAIGITTSITLLQTGTGGGIVPTLADGAVGQIKHVVISSGTAAATITPANLNGGTVIELEGVGSSVTLLFANSGWNIIGLHGGEVDPA